MSKLARTHGSFTVCDPTLSIQHFPRKLFSLVSASFAPCCSSSVPLITLRPFLAAGSLSSLETSGFAFSPTAGFPQAQAHWPASSRLLLDLPSPYLYSCLWGFPASLCLTRVLNHLSESAFPISVTLCHTSLHLSTIPKFLTETLYICLCK